MDLITQIAQHIIAIILALFVTINFCFVGLITLLGIDGIIGTIIGITIIISGVTFSFLIFNFIKNLIIKSTDE